MVFPFLLTCVSIRRSVVSDSLWPHGACQAPLSLVFPMARILEWVALPFSRRSSWPRVLTQISCIAVRFFTIWATGEAWWIGLMPLKWDNRELSHLYCYVRPSEKSTNPEEGPQLTILAPCSQTSNLQNCEQQIFLAMATHSSTLTWKIPWTEEPGRLQSMGSLRVRHDWATSLSLFTFMHWRMKWQPTPVFLPGGSQGWGSLVGWRLWGRTESDTTEAT